jgi:tetratricopeptide (TPR) repeat protein
MRGELDSQGTLKAHGELTMRGDSEVLFRAVFHMSARSSWQDVLQAISYRLGFGGDVTNVQIDEPEATKQPFHLSYDYLRKKYGDWDNRQISPPCPVTPFNFIDEDKPPKSPIKPGIVATTICSTELTLPPGYTMDAPSSVDLKTNFAEYHAKYSVTGGKFLAERTLILLKKEVPVEDWQKYVAFQKEIQEDFGHLTPIAAPGTAPPAVATTDNPEAAELIQKAWEDIQNRELDTAEDKLDKAKRLNPHQTNLNAGYGSFYMAQGKMEDGLNAIRAELKEHPDNLRVARWFVQMLTRMKRDDEAIEIYRAVLKTVPGDVDSTSELARLLVEKQDWKAAQPVLEQAIKLRSDSAQVQAWYGQSCLKNGKDAEGEAALKAAAGATDDPAMLSTIAAALADSGKALDVAEHAARRAVTMIEQQTASLSLDDITNPQLKKMTDLAQIWDGMGWTAFKAGELDVGEKYSLAAWMLAQEPAAGDHLGQIYEKEGKNLLAFDAYRLAKARAYPAVAGIDDRIAALEKRIGRASLKGEKSAQLPQDLRLIHLPRVKPITASADFLILFVGGKVSAVKLLGGDAKLAPYVDLLKQAQFNVPFPDDGPEHVIRQGILSCSEYDPKCMFIMMLPADANTRSRMGTPVHADETKAIHLPHN